MARFFTFEIKILRLGEPSFCSDKNISLISGKLGIIKRSK